MKKFMNEFKEFALRGNVMNLAVGMIIGMGFQAIVSSLTDDILSPIIGLLIGQNFDYLQLDLLGVTIRYGSFLTSILNFVIMAFVVFLLVRSMNKLLAAQEDTAKKDDEAKEPEHRCEFCMTTLQEGATRCPACTSHFS